jgi:hypothetical protein
MSELSAEVRYAMTRQSIPLSVAMLCQDCKMISDATLVCPTCGSHALMNLAGVLDRERGENDGNHDED